MQGAHHVLHFISPFLANDRLSGPLGGLWDAIPLPTALHAIDATTTLWTPTPKVMKRSYRNIQCLKRGHSN